MSMTLPAAMGTMTFNGFVGQDSARASKVASPNPIADSSIRQRSFMTSSLSPLAPWVWHVLSEESLVQSSQPVQYITSLVSNAHLA
jgi:hypothetical protein